MTTQMRAAAAAFSIFAVGASAATATRTDTFTGEYTSPFGDTGMGLFIKDIAFKMVNSAFDDKSMS